MSESELRILHRNEEESWNAFFRRVHEVKGDMLIVLTAADNKFLHKDEERKIFFAECAKWKDHLTLASKDKKIVADARHRGVRVIDRTRQLRSLLKEHPQLSESLRLFSPGLWRQQWRSRLQHIGLLALPKMRIWILIGLSAVLFFFVVFRLLPSADVKVWPRRDIITHTTNIVLVISGATLNSPDRVKTLPLVPIGVTVDKSIDFDQISQEFIGADAQLPMTVTNNTDDSVTLRQGTRFQNQAGMVFRSMSSITIPSKAKATVQAKADHEDIYQKIVGDRGNVPAGVQWILPGLPADQQKLVYGMNGAGGSGGRTAYRKVLQKKDLDAAEKQLKQELLLSAKQQLDERKDAMNAENTSSHLELLNKDDLIRSTYTGFILPLDKVGTQVDSIPVQGKLTYTVPAYDSTGILRQYGYEVEQHVGQGKQLVDGSITTDPQQVIVIEWADNFSWIKITTDITATEEYVLDPLTPAGASFGKKVRDAIAGLSVKDAERIVRNFTEVDKADISVWPPWGRRIPELPSSIMIHSEQ